MVFVRFSFKAAYVIIIALFLSFIYGMIGFAVFESGMGEEKLGEVFMPSYVFASGLLLVLTEKWLRISDPMATVVLWGLSVRFYGYALILLSIYLFGNLIYQNGWREEIQSIIIFTFVSNALLLSLYLIRRWLHTGRS